MCKHKWTNSVLWSKFASVKKVLQQGLSLRFGVRCVALLYVRGCDC
jgi:hypothetical protein